MADNHPSPSDPSTDRPAWLHGLALVLLIAAPTIGVVTSMFIAPGTVIGITTQALAKVWILVLPLVWILWIARPRKTEGMLGLLRPPAFRGRGVVAGLVTGILTLIVIIGAWELVAKSMVDPAVFAEKIASVGLNTPLKYLAFAAALTLINALLEEYVWRWFVFERFRDFLRGFLNKPKGTTGLTAALITPAAVALAALGFMLHHTIAMSLYFDPLTNALASLGVFIGGVTWSIIYLKYKNIYAGYISHIFADIALFYVGYQIAFGV